ELLRVVDAGELEDADADPVARDPEADAAARQPVLPEERLQRRREPIRLAQLAADDDPRVERLLGDLEHARNPVVDDVRGGDVRAPDLEAEHLLLPARRLAL